MLGLGKKSVVPEQAADQELAAQLEERIARARATQAELDALTNSYSPGQEVTVARLRAQLDAELTAAIEASQAKYRLALGPLAYEASGVGFAPDPKHRVKWLRRLARKEAQEADAIRRQLALARTHYRVAARDDAAVLALESQQARLSPKQVGTKARTLATQH